MNWSVIKWKQSSASTKKQQIEVSNMQLVKNDASTPPKYKVHDVHRFHPKLQWYMMYNCVTNAKSWK